MDEYYRIIKEIDRESAVSQRQIASRLGYSLGKVNYLIGALVEKGLVKLENFTGSNNKLAYRYVLTPRGVKEKYHITMDFLRRKEAEYELLRHEIEEARILAGQAGED